jgi:hypothetical protein
MAAPSSTCSEPGSSALHDLRRPDLHHKCARAQFVRLADAATREGQTHIGYLEALLAAEMEETREPGDRASAA